MNEQQPGTHLFLPFVHDDFPALVELRFDLRKMITSRCTVVFLTM